MYILAAEAAAGPCTAPFETGYPCKISTDTLMLCVFWGGGFFLKFFFLAKTRKSETLHFFSSKLWRILIRMLFHKSSCLAVINAIDLLGAKMTLDLRILIAVKSSVQQKLGHFHGLLINTRFRFEQMTAPSA